MDGANGMRSYLSFRLVDSGSHRLLQLVGLDWLHSIGIVHRDIKPENVLIDYQNNARISDFGFAWIAEERGRLDAKKKYGWHYLGTPVFMAPEVKRVRKQDMDSGDPYADDPFERDANLALYGLKADYWSLGLVFYELAAWKHGRVSFFVS